MPTDTVARSVPNLQLQTRAVPAARSSYQANPQYLYIVDGIAFGNNVVECSNW